jgi:hypothetical protein
MICRIDRFQPAEPQQTGGGHMTDVQTLLKTFADGLKSMAQGIDSLAERIEDIAKNQTDSTSGAAAAGKAGGKSRRAAKAPGRSPKTKPRKAKAKPARKKSGAKKRSASVSDTVLEMVVTAKDGIRTAEIVGQSGLKQKQVANALYKLKKQGKIVSPSKGLYTAA